MTRRTARAGAALAPVLASVLALATLAGCGSSTAPGASSPNAASPSALASSGASPEASSTASGGSSVAAPRAADFPDWPTYHRTPSRTGRVGTSVGHLHRAWTARLSGAVYGEPIVADGLVIAATEHDDVYALDPVRGTVRWRRHLGTPVPLAALPCGNIDPLGITGTPAYDAASGSVFVVAETTGGRHTLWALDARTGHRRWHRGLDTQTDRARLAEQQRSALLVTHGRVIATFGGLAGDCANYVGYATSVATSGAGPVRSYAVPTPREAGMWAPPGPVRGRNGNVYVAAGNGARSSGPWDHSDSVTELAPVSLRRLAAFAPSRWREDNAADLDLGSAGPVVVGHRIVVAGKRGVVYLLRPRLGGVGAALASLGGCTAFGGAAVVDAHTVLMPCLGERSIRELHVGAHRLSWGWSAPGIYASPVVAGGRAYVADRDSGDLVVLRLSDGHVVQRLHAGALTHFPSAAVSGRTLLVPTLDGVTAFRGR
ncbi:MAG: outer membrane protein assembly factor BamB family protein [Marmoricola sp.]